MAVLVKPGRLIAARARLRAVSPSRAGVPIAVTSAVKRYGALAALRDVSLEFPAGRLTAVLGPSGCGKTTLLRAIAGFVTLDSGGVRFGRDLVTDQPPQQRGTAMVFQNYALWPHMTVFDNVAYGLRLSRTSKPDIDTRVREALTLVEIGDVDTIARRKPGALSGGQQQRVALARALVVEPRVLLLDEPLSNLDAKIRQRLRVEIRRLQRRVGITTIYVTHDQEEALAIADRVVLMRAGAIVQTGSPEEVYLRPATEFAADFLGVGTRVPARAEAGALVIAGTKLPYSGSERGAVALVVRSSDLSIDETGALAGDLEESLFLGAHWRHYVRIGETLVIVDGPAPYEPGPVRVSIPLDRLRVYPSEGGAPC
jgi:ABC-type Fe3+/spermidine/putrescine transport system ATPase subunit